jgi:hypothetical protein
MHASGCLLFPVGSRVCATIFVVWFAKMGETFIGKILGMQQYHSGIKPTYM